MALIQKGNVFSGFITVGDEKYIYEIDATFNEPVFKIDWKLQSALDSPLKKFLQQNVFENPESFHSQLSDFVNEIIKPPTENLSWLQNPLKMCNFLKNLQKDVEEAGEFIENVDIDNEIVNIVVTDAQLRKHHAVLKLNQNYPREAIEVVSHNLPIQKNYSMNCDDLSCICSVTEFCKKFSMLVNTFQEFWNMVTEIDSECCVLDPANPTFKDVLRRIKLTDTLSVSLIFNPFSAKQRPSIKLLGCQSDVNHYRAIMQRNLEDEVWQCEEDLLYNLGNLLEISIPTKMCLDESKDVIESQEMGECAICFMWRLNNEIPNEVCEKTTCRSMYHSSCLFTYLSSVPRNRDYFGKIQGECPNCDETISCSVPKFT